MSTQNINIARDNVEGKCDLKCSYNFKYSESNTTAKNEGIEISLTYDNTNTSPVTYNTQKYNVSKITIMCPSIHTFDGALAAAEICVGYRKTEIPGFRSKGGICSLRSAILVL